MWAHMFTRRAAGILPCAQPREVLTPPGAGHIISVVLNEAQLPVLIRADLGAHNRGPLRVRFAIGAPTVLGDGRDRRSEPTLQNVVSRLSHGMKFTHVAGRQLCPNVQTIVKQALALDFRRPLCHNVLMTGISDSREEIAMATEVKTLTLHVFEAGAHRAEVRWILENGPWAYVVRHLDREGREIANARLFSYEDDAIAWARSWAFHGTR